MTGSAVSGGSTWGGRSTHQIGQRIVDDFPELVVSMRCSAGVLPATRTAMAEVESVGNEAASGPAIGRSTRGEFGPVS